MMGVGLTRLQNPGPPGAKILYGLLLILAVALSLRIVFFLGLCVADDFAYCGFVDKILDEEPYFTPGSEFRSLRWPVILPVVLSFWLFGQSEVAAVWGSFAYSLGGILVLFLIGRRLFGDRVGLYSAMLMAVFPGDVLYATKLMPDIAISFYMGLAVLFFIERGSCSRSAEGHVALRIVRVGDVRRVSVPGYSGLFLSFFCPFFVLRPPTEARGLVDIRCFRVILGTPVSFLCDQDREPLLRTESVGKD